MPIRNKKINKVLKPSEADIKIGFAVLDVIISLDNLAKILPKKILKELFTLDCYKKFTSSIADIIDFFKEKGIVTNTEISCWVCKEKGIND